MYGGGSFLGEDDIEERIVGKKRYSELIYMEIVDDLREMAHMSDSDKRMFVRRDPKGEGAPRKAQTMGIFTSRNPVEGE